MKCWLFSIYQDKHMQARIIGRYPAVMREKVFYFMNLTITPDSWYMFSIHMQVQPFFSEHETRSWHLHVRTETLEWNNDSNTNVAVHSVHPDSWVVDYSRLLSSIGPRDGSLMKPPLLLELSIFGLVPTTCTVLVAACSPQVPSADSPGLRHLPLCVHWVACSKIASYKTLLNPMHCSPIQATFRAPTAYSCPVS